MNLNTLAYIGVMAGVTYLVRALPMMIFKKRITNRFFRSFLYYIPYAVLGAMTFPAILYSTGNTLAAALGMCAAIVLAYMEKSLLTVALAACAVVFIVSNYPL